MSIELILILYIAFRVKHFACDFLFQTDWMALNKGTPGKSGYKPLFFHAGTHAIGTAAIALLFAPAFWWLGPLDFVVHSLIDRIKGLITYKCGWQPSDTVFWWGLGLDQEAHNYTHLIYIIVMVVYSGGVIL